MRSSEPVPTDDSGGQSAAELNAVREAADTVETAVTAARLLINKTAKLARLDRALATSVAADLVADHAAQDVAATRFRTVAAAAQVRLAAEEAAAIVRHNEQDSYGALERASKVATLAHAKATVVAKADAALADAVAVAVVHRARLLADIELSAARALAAQWAVTASAVQALATEAATPLAPH